MSDDKNDGYGLQQFNATDLMKKYIVQQVFRSLDDACAKQELINENSYETSFIKRIDLIEGLLWKYTPDELKDVIKNLHNEMEEQINNVDLKLNKQNRILNQTKIAYDYSSQIFKILGVVLTNSPISVEYVEMEIKGDFKQLIDNIRTPNPVKLFSTEIG